MKFTEENFKILVSYWAGKLNLPLTLFRRDNRSKKFIAYIIYCKDCKVYNFTYNFKELKTYSDYLIMSVIFHELGHIKNYSKLRSKKEKIKQEYIAERFSLDCIKKYYPDYLEGIIKNKKELLKNKKWSKDFDVHAKAFNKIKEYK